MEKNPQPKDFSIQQAMRLAQTPAGQQLIELLRGASATDIQEAMQKAAAGDYSQAKDIITRILADPNAQKLLDQLGRK